MEHTQFVEIYRLFEKALATQSRAEGVKLAKEVIESGQLTLAELYQDILTPLLNHFDYGTDNTRIIREHIRSTLIRTIVESLYPWVQAHSLPANGQKVLVVCPEGEHHEIGARMALDFFELNGFTAVFTGGNTPGKDVVAAIDYQKPTHVALSISNFFNLIKSEQVVVEIQKLYPNVKIIVGGAAFSDPTHRSLVPQSIYLARLEDIAQIAKEDTHVIA